MNLFELFVKIDVDDQASGKLKDIGDKLGKGLETASKIGVSAVASLGAVAVKTFADFEQLAGGAELMFGDAFDTVMENAKNAYMTVQMSQNEYLQQVNGFATGLKTALGGNEQAAAELAHKIVQAEADIVAATGNTQENVANAFNGIMKSNFTMLDNLQIGITPTKEGFQEVIDKVNEWNEANGEATNYQMGNLADMQSALVDYIDMVGMSGYAQKEASGTISGSFASMKAAASDFATSLIDENADVGESWDNLKETVGTFLDNIKPKLGEFLESISPIATAVAGVTAAFVAFKAAASVSSLITALVTSFQAYQKANEGATIAQWALNAAMSANPIVLIVTLIAGLVAALIVLWNTNEGFREAVTNIWEGIKNAFSSAWDFIKDIFSSVGDFFANVWNSITDAFSAVGDWFGEKFSEGKENAQKAWDDTKEVFGKIWNKTKEAFATVGSWFKERFNEGKEKARESWDNAKEVFGKVWENTKQAFSSVGSWFNEKFNEGKESAVKAWDNVKDVFGGIWEKIKEIFSKGSDIGKNIIEGIKKGIQDAWKNLKEWFSGLFDDLIQIAKDILGIKSPSRVFRDEIGKQMAAGLGLGWDDEFGAVKKKIEKSLNFKATKIGVTASVGSFGSGNGGSPYGYGVSVVQNIYSEAKTAADLMEEAIYLQKRAVMLGV